MSNTPDPHSQRLTLEVLARIDEVCTRYEKARQKGEELTIEQLVAGIESAEREQLLLELLLIDLALRPGEDFDQMEADYSQRFPHDGDVVQRAMQQHRDRYQRRQSSIHTVNMTSPVAHTTKEDVLTESNGEKEPKRVRYFGEYEILNEIARGGMGVVFKARQNTLKRVVALKMILSGRFADQAEIFRFTREAQAASRLQHPNIVAIHEIGEHKGRNYFTMDFVEGPSLASVLRKETLAPVKAAKLVRTIAKAVHYAHSQGTIHRDLKPANVLLSKSGTPHVTDFGLAKVFDERDPDSWQRLTETGQVVGTPSYMSPEQASGKIDLVGAASDIWSLGAVLYACLTGRPPFLAETQVETIMQVLNKEPVAPRELNPAIPKDLETICLKCLNKEPHRRYGTAQELVDDLQRFIEGRPVLARPVGRTTKLVRWSKRNPVVASLAALSVLLLVLGSGISTYFAVKANQRAIAENSARLYAEEQEGIALTALADAQASEKKSKKLLRETFWHLYKAELFPMKEAWVDQDFGQLGRLLDASRPEEDEPDFRGWEWYFFQDEVDRRFTTITPQESKFVYVEWSTDGKYLAFRREDNAVEIRDGSDYSLKYVIPGVKQTQVAWQPDTHLLAIAARDHEVEIWDIEEQKIVDTLSTPAMDTTAMSNRAVAWSRDGSRIALGGYRRVDIWSWSGEGQHQKTLQSLATWVSALDWHPDGNQLGAGGSSNAACIDIEKDELKWKRFHNRVRVFDVEWNAKGDRLATSWAWPAWMIRVFDESGKETSFPTTKGPMPALAWDTTGESLISVNHDQSIYFWSPESVSLSRELKIHNSSIYSFDLHQERNFGVSVEASGIAKVWNNKKQPIAAVEVKLPFTWSHIDWNFDGNLIAAANGSSLCIYNLRENHFKLIDLGKRQFAYMDWHPSKDYLAIQDVTGRVTVMDVRSQETLFDQKGSSWDFNHCVAWSPNGQYLASGSGQNWTADALGNVDIWDFNKQTKLCSLGEKGRRRTRISWSADSTKVAVGAFTDKTLEVWDIQEESLVFKTDELYAFWQSAWSPDDRFIAACAMNGPVQVIDSSSGQVLTEMGSHNLRKDRVQWSSDGSRVLINAEQDATLCICDAATGEELILFGPEPTIGYSAVWSPDGQRIATFNGDAMLRIWGTEHLKLPEEIEFLKDGLLAPLPQAVPVSNDISPASNEE